MAVDIQKRNKRQNEWQKANGERLNIVFEKGTKARIEEVCSFTGQSVSAFVREAVEKRLKEFDW